VDYDVIVIGGGITGVAVLRDCALRGLRGLLVEAHDLGAGASSVRDGLLDGGVAPLDPARRRSLRAEVEVMRRIGGHLLRAVPLLWPVLPTGARRPAMGLGALATVAAAQCPREPDAGGHWTLLRGEEIRAFEPAVAASVTHAVLTATWHIDPLRLVAQAARAACDLGAEVTTRARVVGLLRSGAAVTGVEVEDTRTGSRRAFSARVVVNAAGAWGDEIAALADVALPLRRFGLVSLRLLRRQAFSALVLGAAAPGVRATGGPGETTVGPLEVPVAPDASAVEVAPVVSERLLAATARLLPAVAEARPLEVLGALSARHAQDAAVAGAPPPPRLIDHAVDGAPGLLSVRGGALLEQRPLAEQAGEAVRRLSGHGDDARSDRTPLPCDEGMTDPALWSQQFGISLDAAERLCARHGSRSHEILKRGDKHGGLPLLCRCQAVGAAELRYDVGYEHADSVEDLIRRSGLGRGPCTGVRCLTRAARLLHRVKGWDGARCLTQLRQVKQARFEVTRSVLDGDQVAAFVTDQLAHRLSGGLGHPAWSASIDGGPG